MGSGVPDPQRAEAITVRKDNQCEFGKWLYGSDLSQTERKTENYLTVKQLHAQFHEQAAKVVELVISGQKEAAEKAIGLSGDYTKVSSELTKAMTRWRLSL